MICNNCIACITLWMQNRSCPRQKKILVKYEAHSHSAPHACVQEMDHHDRTMTITPRRRSGDRREPVLLTRERIESYFSMPLSAASRDLVRRCLGPWLILDVYVSPFSPSFSALIHRKTNSPATLLQGLCATAIKKVCRRLGIPKWPFRFVFLLVLLSLAPS